ncbi:hypothetical protein ACFL4N_04050 [Thermodesulfobacteriota bacterium]
MDFDDDFEDEYDDPEYDGGENFEGDDYSDRDSPDSDGEKEENGSIWGLDPLDVALVAGAYAFLSDDAQDEIERRNRRKMQCLSCGNRFFGEVTDDCPECFSPSTKEISS